MDKEDMVCIYNGIRRSCEKEWNNAICSNMDGLQMIILSEVSQIEEDKCHRVLLICGIQKTIEMNLFIE